MNETEPPFIGLVRQYMQQADPLERIRAMAYIQRVTSVVLTDEITMARKNRVSWMSISETLDMPRPTLARQYKERRIVVPASLPVPALPTDERNAR